MAKKPLLSYKAAFALLCILLTFLVVGGLVSGADREPNVGVCDTHISTQDACRIEAPSGKTLKVVVNEGFDYKRIEKSSFYGKGTVASYDVPEKEYTTTTHVDDDNDPNTPSNDDDGTPGEDTKVSRVFTVEAHTVTGGRGKDAICQDTNNNYISCEKPLPEEPTDHDNDGYKSFVVSGVDLIYIRPTDGNVGFENLGTFGKTVYGKYTDKERAKRAEALLAFNLIAFVPDITDSDKDGDYTELVVADPGIAALRCENMFSQDDGFDFLELDGEFKKNEISPAKIKIIAECKKNIKTPQLRWEKEASTFTIEYYTGATLDSSKTYYIHDNQSPFWDTNPTDASVPPTHRDDVSAPAPPQPPTVVPTRTVKKVRTTQPTQNTQPSQPAAPATELIHDWHEDTGQVPQHTHDMDYCINGVCGYSRTWVRHTHEDLSDAPVEPIQAGIPATEKPAPEPQHEVDVPRIVCQVIN